MTPQCSQWREGRQHNDILISVRDVFQIPPKYSIVRSKIVDRNGNDDLSVKYEYTISFLRKCAVTGRYEQWQQKYDCAIYLYCKKKSLHR